MTNPPHKIEISKDGVLQVPDQVIIPFMIGDGIGPDLWRAVVRVVDQAVLLAYDGQKKIHWKEVLAGEKAFKETGSWLPEETIQVLDEYVVSIKGPLTTPVGGGIRSLNVALRKALDLYVCLRPTKWYPGVPSPIKHPERVDMVLFRENTEDIYAGIEFEAHSEQAAALQSFLQKQLFVDYPFTKDTGLGIKVVSQRGSQRLIRAAIQYAILHQKKSVTLVHKGNIMKFTEGAFAKWGYELAEQEFSAHTFTWKQYDQIVLSDGKEAAQKAQDAAQAEGKVLIKDMIADNFLQQILIQPEAFDVVATLNLNGDYISDALAAMVGGIGIAPGANINYQTGKALFEATHGTAPNFAHTDTMNPSSLLLSAQMMLSYLGWKEAADAIDVALQRTLQSKHVTIDFYNQMEDATLCSTSAFGNRLILELQHLLRPSNNQTGSLN
jgi:isocitrate dehydrogenase